MHILAIYAHPSKNSFTARVLKEFLKGLTQAKHSFEVHDLYDGAFNCILDISHYEREMSWMPREKLPADVQTEQDRIQKADALAFIYPVWWSDCPAILKGWFDRVWSNGYAYSYKNDKRESFIKPKKAIVLCTAGHTVEHLEETGIADSMRCVMIRDRLNNVGFTDVKMVILGGMVQKDEAITRNNLKVSFEQGFRFCRGKGNDPDFRG
jgi:NAD(P)H dehydrogenase (quinone)